MKILMVCLGNICRSPLAEGVLRSKVLAQGLDWSVDSAGTGSWHIGSPPDSRSVAVARRYGIDISGLRARQFSAHDFDLFDVIVVMDSSNYRDVMHKARSMQDKEKVWLLRNYVSPNRNEAVPDPYYDDALFEVVYRQVDEACSALIKHYSTEMNDTTHG